MDDLEIDFRSWLKTANTLYPPTLMTDSNMFVMKIVSNVHYVFFTCTDIVQTQAVDSWQFGDTPLPPMIYSLSDIFSQIPLPPNAFISPEYFRDVLNAIDAGHKVPPIPSHIYLLASLPATASMHALQPTTEKGKGKRLRPSQSDAEATQNTAKKHRITGTPVQESEEDKENEHQTSKSGGSQSQISCGDDSSLHI